MEDAMEKMVEDYFEMESFCVKLAPQVAASDDARAQRILEDTTVKVGRRYQTGLLWKDDHAVLPRSYEMAHRRLINVEKKLKRNGQLALEYDRIIKDCVYKGYARKLQQDEVAAKSEAIEVSTRAKEIHAEAGFELCQFLSSSPIVEAALGPPERVKSVGWGRWTPWDSSDVIGTILGMEQFGEQRVMYEDGNVLASFVCAKTKCAPMRMMSIPRLELQAAVFGTRLMNIVKEEHSVDISETFVGNRVAEILESSKVSQWRWVPTADNAADDATRSQKKATLSPESRWLSGPAFLRQPASSWPVPEEGTERVPDASDYEEMPSEFALVATNEFVIPFQRFSSFSRLVRTTAWVLRFARWCRKQRSELEEYGLTATQCEAAENMEFCEFMAELMPRCACRTVRGVL
ncbi:uncharacterized protein [Drosophila kikkawai]|uniref:Uncharacterized protein n=1 Tax=Drosophila kikkawai TaxID=30033 RepID=A0ABM4GFZ1_DROKI